MSDSYKQRILKIIKIILDFFLYSLYNTIEEINKGGLLK